MDPSPERRPRQPKRVPPPSTTELRRSKRIKTLTEVSSGVDAASEPPEPKTKVPKHVKATATETPKKRETKPKLPKAPKQTESKKRLPVTLSQWAVAHFLAPREQRRGCRIEDDAPLEPLDDHILRDFSTRFRGSAGNVEADKEDAVAVDGEGGDESESRSDAKRVALVVGAPQNNSYPFSHATTFGMASRAGMGAYGKRPQHCTVTFEVRLSAEERESRYFGKDLALKCSICRHFGHSTSLCAKNKVVAWSGWLGVWVLRLRRHRSLMHLTLCLVWWLPLAVAEALFALRFARPLECSAWIVRLCVRLACGGEGGGAAVAADSNTDVRRSFCPHPLMRADLLEEPSGDHRLRYLRSLRPQGRRLHARPCDFPYHRQVRGVHQAWPPALHADPAPLQTPRCSAATARRDMR